MCAGLCFATATFSKAPEAGNILWENLELTKRERGRRKTLTLWVTIVLLGLSFLILYASNIAEKEFNAAGESFTNPLSVTHVSIVVVWSVLVGFNFVHRLPCLKYAFCLRQCQATEAGCQSK